MAEACDHSVGYLTAHYDSDEGVGSTYDLAADFADDETYAVYAIYHDIAKNMRVELSRLATCVRIRIEQMEKGE